MTPEQPATSTPAPIRLVTVGGGPRAAMLLERLLAHLEGSSAPLDITVVDPHPPGPGRIWRREQSGLLKLNSMAQDVTVFTDDTCTIAGPVRPGPSLIEWAELVRSGILSGVEIHDAGVWGEVQSLRGDSFPTRRLQSCYLHWFWRTTVAAAPEWVSVRWRQDSVTAVQDQGSGYSIDLAGGDRLSADTVVYAVGHTARRPTGATSALIDKATSQGLRYIPPAFTADADYSAIAPGEDVIVRGLGLAAVDLVVLLTEGRGGRFERSADGSLAYLPSGDEPRLHLGSRRGVPYRSKVSSVLQGAPPELGVLTKATLAGLLARPGLVDFDTDVWPLIARELVWAHYRELFTGHPERVHATWEEFRSILNQHADDARALEDAVEEFVPDPLDRFDVPRFDRPLGDEAFASDDALQERIRRHIADDLALRTTQDRSSAQAVFLAALFSFMALADIPTERWSARSRAVALPLTWHTFFSYLASGPPSHRLEELVALSQAAIVHFLGPEVAVRVDPRRGFVASSPQAPGETTARTLVDAWLPGSGAAVSENPALRELALAHGRELQVSDASSAGSLGRVEVEPSGRVLSAEGRAHERLFALGPFTSLTESGAFTRPRSNALSLRQTDAVAGEIAAELRVLWGRRRAVDTRETGWECDSIPSIEDSLVLD